MMGAAELNPIVGTYNAGYTSVTGKDPNDFHKVNKGERTQAIGQTAAAVSPFLARVKIAQKTEKTAETTVKWSAYRGIHVPPSNTSWKKIIESTTSGSAKYKPGVNIEALERGVWAGGKSANNGKPWKVMEFPNEIGASGGKSSRWVRVENADNTLHGHPITQQEFQKLTKEK
jgi:hypothetical protein